MSAMFDDVQNEDTRSLNQLWLIENDQFKLHKNSWQI